MIVGHFPAKKSKGAAKAEVDRTCNKRCGKVFRIGKGTFEKLAGSGEGDRIIGTGKSDRLPAARETIACWAGVVQTGCREARAGTGSWAARGATCSPAGPGRTSRLQAARTRSRAASGSSEGAERASGAGTGGTPVRLLESWVMAAFRAHSHLGAREHNLKGIDLELPRNALIVMTGLSGSGKSSLAFDTIYAEGQRRYVESLSAYARQFLGLMEKPDVDSIEGLSPGDLDRPEDDLAQPALDGRHRDRDLRLPAPALGADRPSALPRVRRADRGPVGRADHRPRDDPATRAPASWSSAPVVRGRKGEFEKLLEQFRLEGYSRVRIDGELRRLDEEIKLDKKYKHDISVVVDRLVMKTDLRRRLSESIEAAAGLAGGVVEIDVRQGRGAEQAAERGRRCQRAPRPPASCPRDVAERLTFSERFACLNCGTSIPELEPRIFSFNSPHGACERCHGLGFQRIVDPELVVPDPTLSLVGGRAAALAHRALALLEAAGRGGRRRRRGRPRQALAGAERRRARDLPLRHRLRAPQGQLHEPLRPPPLLQRPLRGDRQQPRAPLRGDRLGRGARAGRGLHGRAALPRLRRRPAAAREPRGQGRRASRSPTTRELSARAALDVDRGAGADRDRAGDRAAADPRDQRAARLPRERRRRLPQPGALGADALGRRGAADPARDPDRLQPGRRPLHPRRALDRPAPARQREADRARSSGCATSATP